MINPGDKKAPGLQELNLYILKNLQKKKNPAGTRGFLLIAYANLDRITLRRTKQHFRCSRPVNIRAISRRSLVTDTSPLYNLPLVNCKRGKLFLRFFARC